MSETKTFPDFHQDLTRDPGQEARPKISDEERAESARLFNRAFDNWLSRHQQDINRGTAEDGRQVSQLTQKIELEGKAYALTVIELGPHPAGNPPGQDIRPGEDINRLINLQLAIGGRFGDLSSYRLCTDGVVRRYDVDAEANQTLQEMANRDIQSAGGHDQARQRLIDSQTNYRENVRFEEDMGVNNQPVWPEEIAGLAKFLDQAGRPARKRPPEKASPYL